MPLPKIPRLERFCFCLDVHTGVQYASIGLCVIWIIYAVLALIASIGAGIWALIWCVGNVAAYVLVILGMKKSNKLYVIPALVLSVFNIVVGVIQAIINFVSLWFFSAVAILVITALTTYYILGLKTVYDDLASGGPQAAEPADSKPQTINPV